MEAQKCTNSKSAPPAQTLPASPERANVRRGAADPPRPVKLSVFVCLSALPGHELPLPEWDPIIRSPRPQKRFRERTQCRFIFTARCKPQFETVAALPPAPQRENQPLPRTILLSETRLDSHASRR